MHTSANIFKDKKGFDCFPSSTQVGESIFVFEISQESFLSQKGRSYTKEEYDLEVVRKAMVGHLIE